MRIKCDYCDAVYEDTLDRCPSCGASNTKRNVGDLRPRTIEELKQWYKDRALPPYETTRFFIGINYQQPRAFGIYKDGSEFVVYKNKADGSRAVRYQGTDEEYAVNELYQKLKDEIVNQKHLSEGRKNGQRNGKPKTFKESIYDEEAGLITGNGFFIIGLLSFLLVPILAIPILIFMFIFNLSSSKNEKAKKAFVKSFKVTIFFAGIFAVIAVIITALAFKAVLPRHMTGYYQDNGNYYYYDSHINNWYYYDSDSDYWYHQSTPDFYTYHKDSEELDYYYMGKYYGNWDSSQTKFSSIDTNSSHDYDVQAYKENHSSYDSSYDSGYDWDSGSDSWDSDGTDWDSDW